MCGVIAKFQISNFQINFTVNTKKPHFAQLIKLEILRKKDIMFTCKTYSSNHFIYNFHEMCITYFL